MTTPQNLVELACELEDYGFERVSPHQVALLLRRAQEELVDLRRRQFRPGHQAGCPAQLDSERVCRCGQ
jgi:hypothetical protein